MFMSGVSCTVVGALVYFFLSVSLVCVLCWLAAPVAMFYGDLQNLVIRSKSVIKSSSVISSQIGVMSDQLRVSLYMVMSQNVM